MSDTKPEYATQSLQKGGSVAKTPVGNSTEKLQKEPFVR